MDEFTYESTKKPKVYKAGSLLNTPNSNFASNSKKMSKNISPARPSMNIEKAKKKLDDAKGKIP